MALIVQIPNSPIQIPNSVLGGLCCAGLAMNRYDFTYVILAISSHLSARDAKEVDYQRERSYSLWYTYMEPHTEFMLCHACAIRRRRHFI